MKKLFRFLAVLCVSAILISMTACGSPGSAGSEKPGGAPSEDTPITIIANSAYTADNLLVQGMLDFAKLVKEKTNGTVTINVETGGALGINSYDTLRSVKNGELPMSELVLVGLEGDEKIMGIYGLPFLCSDYESAQMFWDMSKPYLQKTAEEKWNQKILYAGPWPFTNLWSQAKIDSIADMNGLKTRSMDKNNSAITEATGGTPYALQFSEVYSSLATNLIDSVWTSTQSAVDGKFWEVLDYYEVFNMAMSLNAVSINLDVWNKLSPGQQAALEESAAEIEKKLWAQIVVADAEYAQTCIDNGITKNEPSDAFKAELVAIAKDYHAKWLKDSDASVIELYNAYQEAVGGQAVHVG